MRTLNRPTLAALILIGLIGALAAWLRLGNLGVTEFYHDEALLTLRVLDWLDGGPLPLTGIPSSVGIPNPPHSVYALIPAFALSRDPVFVTGYIALLNVIGVGLVYAVGQAGGLSQATGLVGAALYAVNPYAVLYSRKIWAQDYHTPILLLAAWLLLIGLGEKPRRWAQALALPVLIFGLCIHFAAWAILPAFVWLVWAGRRRLSVPHALIGTALAGLVLAPYLIGLSETLRADPNRISNALGGRGAGITLSGEALRFTALLATGSGVESAAGVGAALAGPDDVGVLVVFFLAVAPIGFLGRLAGESPRGGFGFALTLWAFAPLIVFTPTWTATYPHYFIGSLPAYALLIAVGGVWATRRFAALIGPFGGEGIWGAVLALVVGSQAAWWPHFVSYVDQHAHPDGFRTPIRALLPIREAVESAQPPIRTVVIMTDNVEWQYSTEAAVWPALLGSPDRCVVALTPGLTALTPESRRAVYVLPPGGRVGAAWGAPLGVYPLREGEGEYRVYSAEAVQPLPPDPLVPIKVEFAGGLRVEGFVNNGGSLALEWTLPARPHPDAPDPHYFVHFLNAAGDKIGQADRLLMPTRYWCAGHTIRTWTAPPPPETVTLRIGVYTLPAGGGFANLPRADGSGMWVDVPNVRR